MTEPLLEVRALVKHFPVRGGYFGAPERGVVHAVDDVSFSIGAGDTLVVKVANKSGAARPALGEAVRLAWNVDDARWLPMDKEEA